MASACVGITTLALLGSFYINVYGEGLAIRGPPGSVVKAIDGMIQEQQNAVILFVGSMITFVLQQVGMCWLMMDQANAIASTVILLGGMIYTYRVATRIFNRFWWDKTRTDWKDEVDQVTELNDLNPTVGELYDEYGASRVDQAYRISLHRGLLNGRDSELKKRSVLTNLLNVWYKKKSPLSTKSTSAEMNPSSISSSPTTKRLSVFPKSRKRNSKSLSPLIKNDLVKPSTESQQHGEQLFDPYYDTATVISDAPYMQITALNDSLMTEISDSNKNNTKTIKANLADLRAGGYLTMKTKAATGFLSGDPWERRYFIIKKTLVYYYKDKRSFELDHSRPLNRRPIDLEGYGLEVGAEEPPYLLSLVPTSEDDIRKIWSFRTDTLAEFRSWKDIFTKAIEAANRSQFTFGASSSSRRRDL
eukprot:scaffold3349_cov165-Ochromonas_danica.AAC.8